MIEKGYIYGLRLSDSSEYRYVGLTTTTPKQRLGRHILDSRRSNIKPRPVLNWIRKYKDQIVVDTLEELDNTTVRDLGEAESYWISQITGFGHRLLNLSLGGESGSYGARWKLKPDQIRYGEKSGFYGKKHTEESNKSNSDKHKGKVLSAETRAKMSASRSGEKHWAYGIKYSEEHRSKISKGLKGKKPTEEALENMRRAGELRRGRPFTEEHKRNISQAKKGKKLNKPAWNKGLSNPCAHIRWHTNKGISKPETCNFCREESEI